MLHSSLNPVDHHIPERRGEEAGIWPKWTIGERATWRQRFLTVSRAVFSGAKRAEELTS
jgi:hypothetical protein